MSEVEMSCPTCHRPRRERGETRTRIWLCGCVVAPDEVLLREAPGGELLWEARGLAGTSATWPCAQHPTREGAISAWREALAAEQRREDELAAHPLMAIDASALSLAELCEVATTLANQHHERAMSAIGGAADSYGALGWEFAVELRDIVRQLSGVE